MTTIASIKRANHEAGQHWFEPDTMRFFNSRILSHTWPAADGRAYFITSERRDGWNEVPRPRRRYTIRVAMDGGRDINTVGEFQAYATADAARRAIAHLLA